MGTHNFDTLPTATLEDIDYFRDTPAANDFCFRAEQPHAKWLLEARLATICPGDGLHDQEIIDTGLKEVSLAYIALRRAHKKPFETVGPDMIGDQAMRAATASSLTLQRGGFTFLDRFTEGQPHISGEMIKKLGNRPHLFGIVELGFAGLYEVLEDNAFKPEENVRLRQLLGNRV
jgi:hypothetical protein